MSAVTKWSNDDFMKFLDVFQKHEILWNNRSAAYMNKAKRDNAYQRFIEELEQNGFKELTVHAVKKKVKTVKDVHRYEFCKVAKSRTSGSDRLYRPRLAWYEKANSFLGAVVASRSSTSATVSEDMLMMR